MIEAHILWHFCSELATCHGVALAKTEAISTADSERRDCGRNRFAGFATSICGHWFDARTIPTILKAGLLSPLRFFVDIDFLQGFEVFVT